MEKSKLIEQIMTEVKDPELRDRLLRTVTANEDTSQEERFNPRHSFPFVAGVLAVIFIAIVCLVGSENGIRDQAERAKEAQDEVPYTQAKAFAYKDPDTLSWEEDLNRSFQVKALKEESHIQPSVMEHSLLKEEHLDGAIRVYVQALAS